VAGCVLQEKVPVTLLLDFLFGSRNLQVALFKKKCLSPYYAFATLQEKVPVTLLMRKSTCPLFLKTLW